MEQNQLFYELDLQKMKWKVLEDFSKSTKVAPRENHTATYFPKFKLLLICGGFAKADRTIDMLLYKVDRSQWSALKVPKAGKNFPCVRSGHSAVEYQDKLYVYGGQNQDGVKLNDMWVFDPNHLFWRQIETPNSQNAYEMDEDSEPLARSGHTACVVNDLMFVYGGIYDIARELNDMHVFDLRQEKWFKIYEDMENMSPIKMRFQPPRKSTTGSQKTRSKPSTAMANDSMRRNNSLNRIDSLLEPETSRSLGKSK